MGVGSAFTTALGGLNAYSQQVGYISDNLANISTPGFKRVDADFQSFVTRSTLRYHSPGGVTVQPSYQTTTGGQVGTNTNPTSFAISDGVGFAPVKVPASTAGGVASFTNSLQHYTRACDFSVDANGYLVNSAGEFLMGMQEQTSYLGNIPGTPSLGSLVGVRVDPTIYKSIPGVASTTVKFNANFPASAAIGSTQTSQVQFYDSLGNSQTLQIVYTKVAPAAPPANLATTSSVWRATGATIPGVAAATVAINGGANADLEFTSTGALNAPAAGTFPFAVTWPASVGSTTPQTVTMSYGTPASAGPPAVAASGSTQYAGTSLEVRSVTDTTGQGPGSFQKASIDKDGYVVFSYSNGQQLKPYRIPLVSFSDATKLERITGAVFGGNDNYAGKPVARWAGEGDSGTIVPNAQEQSNVDIADELTKMIVAQRAYSSNGKVITTSDEMLQEALGLKR